MKHNRARHCHHRDDEVPGHECRELQTGDHVFIDGEWLEVKVYGTPEQQAAVDLLAPGALWAVWGVLLFATGNVVSSVLIGASSSIWVRAVALAIYGVVFLGAAAGCRWLVLCTAESAGVSLDIVGRWTFRLGVGAALFGFLMGLL